MSTLQYADGTKVNLNEPIWVEMTLMGVHFTDERVPVYYYDMPEYK